MKTLSGILIILFVLLSCARQNEYAFPLIQTGDVTDIDNTGAVFHASITDLSKDNIVEYGFVWSLNENPDINSSKITFSESPKTGYISKKVSSDFLADTIYYVKAFARNNNYTTYGKVVTFRSKGSLAPVINDFNPKEGSNSTQVTITGENFSSSIEGNIVRFGKATATVVEANSDKLVVTLPADLKVSGKVNIFVQTANQIAKSGSFFNLYGCNILNISPVSLIGGDMILVKAEYLNSELQANILKIGDKVSELAGIAHDTLFAYVPYDATPGKNEISLTVDGKTCFGNDSVLVKNPWKAITNYTSPNQGIYSGFTIEDYGYVLSGAQLWKFHPGDFILNRCADLPGEFSEWHLGFSINGKGYACFGLGVDGIYYTYLYEYDPIQNSWLRKSDFPGLARTGSICTVLGEKAYVGMGVGVGGIGLLKDFWEYDPALDKWTQMADFPGTSGSEMVGFSVNKKGYIGLGTGNQIYPVQKGFWEYDPQFNKWAQLADFPGIERVYAIGFSIGNSGYIGTGWMASGYGAALSDFWRYDVDNKRWIRIADIPGGGRYESVSLVLNNKGYICSGIFTGNDLIEFNPN